LYDIGGGNGFVALGMQKAGFDVVLVEPGTGAMNAAKRGLQRVIWATLNDAGLHDGAVPAAAVFDVVEHIEDDISFVKTIRRTLKPGGRFYCTVPASGFLWSGEDSQAGHFRRYNRATLADVMGAAGFEVEFISSFFSWLTVPVFFLRALPWRLSEGRRKGGNVSAVRADHTLPAFLAEPVRWVHSWEISRIRRKRTIPFGTSLLCVARAIPS